MATITVSGGTKWKAYLERLAQKVQVRAGVLRGAKNSEGKSIAASAAYNEFGTTSIPARPCVYAIRKRHQSGCTATPFRISPSAGHGPIIPDGENSALTPGVVHSSDVWAASAAGQRALLP